MQVKYANTIMLSINVFRAKLLTHMHAHETSWGQKMPHYWILIDSMEITRQPHPALIHTPVQKQRENLTIMNQKRKSENYFFITTCNKKYRLREWTSRSCGNSFWMKKRAVEHPLDLLLPLHKLYYHSRCFFANWVYHMQHPPQTHWRIKAKKMNCIWTMCKAIWESVQVGESGGIFSG